MVALILGLLFLDRLPALTQHTKGFARLSFMVWEMHNGHLNADDYHALTAGYYEGIEQVDRINKDMSRMRTIVFEVDFFALSSNPA